MFISTGRLVQVPFVRAALLQPNLQRGSKDLEINLFRLPGKAKAPGGQSRRDHRILSLFSKFAEVGLWFRGSNPQALS